MQPLTFAVVAKSADTRDLVAGFCQRLQELTAVSVCPRVLTTYADMPRLFISNEVDLAWAPPLVAMGLEDRGAVNLLALVQRPNAAGYHSALFTRADSLVHSLEAIRGTTVAWVSPQSASGYSVPRWHLRSRGIDLSRTFGKELFFPNHDAVARAVWDGDADVGATHVVLDPVSGRLASAPWLHVTDRKGMRVLFLVGPIPGDVIAARRAIPSDVQRQITAALLALRTADVGVATLFEATSFEPVPDGHLSLLRRLARHANEQSLV